MKLEDLQAIAASVERFPHKMECPTCHRTVNTVPAEGVPDQALRGCPECEAVFYQEV